MIASNSKSDNSWIRYRIAHNSKTGIARCYLNRERHTNIRDDTDDCTIIIVLRCYKVRTHAVWCWFSYLFYIMKPDWNGLDSNRSVQATLLLSHVTPTGNSTWQLSLSPALELHVTTDDTIPASKSTIPPKRTNRSFNCRHLFLYDYASENYTQIAQNSSSYIRHQALGSL